MVKLDVDIFLEGKLPPILKVNHLQRWSLTSTPKNQWAVFPRGRQGSHAGQTTTRREFMVTAQGPGFRRPVHTGQHPARCVRAREDRVLLPESQDRHSHHLIFTRGLRAAWGGLATWWVRGLVLPSFAARVHPGASGLKHAPRGPFPPGFLLPPGPWRMDGYESSSREKPLALPTAHTHLHLTQRRWGAPLSSLSQEHSLPVTLLTFQPCPQDV